MKDSDETQTQEHAERFPATEGTARAPKRVGRRTVELLGAISLGLVFFLCLLWMLNVVFPDATGLGTMMRREELQGPGLDRLDSNIWADGESETVATLTAVRRNVRDRPAASITWSRAESGRLLGDRHAIQSYKRSGATITFDSGNELILGEESLIVVRRPRGLGFLRRPQPSVLFIDGVLEGKLGPAGADRTGVAVLASGGTISALPGTTESTDIHLAAGPEGATTLSVLKGAAELKWGEESLVVGENEAVVFDENQPPEASFHLPGPPVPIQPSGDEEFVYRSVPPPIAFEWFAEEATSDFRLVIARDPEFSDVVHDEEVSRARYVHGNLPAGRYFWRVSALRDGAEGLVGEVSRFTVSLDQQPPELEVRFPEGTVRASTLVIEGATDPDSRVFIGDLEVATTHSGEFEETLPLRSGYNIVVVQAVDPAGNTTFESRVINAEFPEAERAL
jgi:hypothetical protein